MISCCSFAPDFIGHPCAMCSAVVVLAVLLVFCAGECLGGHDDVKMYALRDAFEASDSLPHSWHGSTSGDSCEWPGVSCNEDGHVTTLSLSGNQVSSLPPEIGNLTSLQNLWLGDNQLTSVPPEIGNLTALVSLDLYANYLAALPPEIERLTFLQYLWVGDNQLAHVPPEIESLTFLLELGLEINHLISIPREIEHLIRLQRLDLYKNALTSIPEIGNLTSLYYLDLHANLLTSIPEIGNLTSLYYLDLHTNLLVSVPSGLECLVSLRHLNLYDNMLISAPEIWLLTSLLYLDLGTNQLASVPPDIRNLIILQDLNLDDNQLMSVPPEIWGLTSLEELHLHGNQLTSVPPDIGNLTQLWILRLSDNQLTSIPSEIGNLAQLEELHLNDNQLTYIPPEIENLASLQLLDLSNNQLASVPPEIGILTSLRHLNLNNNQMIRVPPEIGQLVGLWTLGLSNNQLTSIPPEIGNLISLQGLDLHHNQITDLPLEIGELSSLVTLYLHNNQLTSVPLEIGNLTPLTKLHLHNNQLTRLPRDMGELSSLQDLNVHTNQLTELLPEVTSMGSLLWLDVSNNKLRSFRVVEGGAVIWLDVSNNQLPDCSFLPNMGNLGRVDISNNPFLPGQRLAGLQRLEFLTARNCFQDDLSSLRLEQSPNLSFVDFSDNSGLRGVLPDALGQLHHLRVLRLRNTSLSFDMKSVCESADPHPCVPTFLEPGPLVTRTQDRHFSCHEPRPPPHGVQSSLLIEIDWDAYFQNQLCRCHTGFVGRLGTCYPCPENSECPGDDDQTVMIPARGYWASVSGNLSSALEDLDLDVCPSLSLSVALSTSWLSVCPLVSRSVCSPSVPRSRDNNEQEYQLWTPCASGYTGRMCTGCMNGYTRWGSRCYECPASGVVWALYSAGAVCAVLIGIALWLWLRKGVNTNTVKTLLFFAQVLALLPSLGISVPSSLAGASEVSSFSSLAIPGISCVWEGYDESSSFWFKWILFVTVVILVFCGNMARTHFWGRSGTVVAGLIFLVTSFYLPLSSSVLRSLRCEWDSCLGESFFASAPHFPCEMDRSVAVRVMAWLLVFLFVFGVPLCLGWVLWRAQSRGKLDDPGVRARIGQLYLCYTAERWWWEGVVTLRRLLIAASVSLISVESGITPLALFLFLLASTELQRAMHPYQSGRENRLEFVTLLLLAVNAVCVCSLGVSERMWARQLIAGLLVGVDVLWVLVLVGVNLKGIVLRLQTKVSDVELARRHD